MEVEEITLRDSFVEIVILLLRLMEKEGLIVQSLGKRSLMPIVIKKTKHKRLLRISEFLREL